MGNFYTSKWFIWLDEIDANYTLPQYCNGNCNALSAKAAHRIWNEASQTNRGSFRIEDMYYLGFMRQKAERKGDMIPVYETMEVTKNYLNVHSMSRSHVKRNGLNRCLHLGGGDATLMTNDSLLVDKKDMFNRVAEWYLDGDWSMPMANFSYGPSKIGGHNVSYGHLMNQA